MTIVEFPFRGISVEFFRTSSRAVVHCDYCGQSQGGLLGSICKFCRDGFMVVNLSSLEEKK